MKETIPKVNSSDISWMSYEGGTLQVRFQTDCIYTYSEVPKAIWNALKNRNKHRAFMDKSTEQYSVGKYFNQEFIDTKYPFTKTGKDCGG